MFFNQAPSYGSRRHRGLNEGATCAWMVAYEAGNVNTQNGRIWATGNPFETQPVTLHTAKVNKWGGFMTSFIIGPDIFVETSACGPITVTTNGQHYEGFLLNYVIPDL
ncbi:uncharacterized protein TNCV_2744201 [Trichonephila clavipes]|nr:uncharacterized protein TNCV_2744201 [Trichonephila clavipes]